ncbi:hypothetical protein M5D96_012487 [Drosophila gunungcola]|uniref:Uncharacterized protein n=1 Tax=Drosophila gunungcola TaxID=103775 RepID=A0A9P9YDD2_9MUSC|nr:hypothetical protein M5D96_012487 [Drosophila gunungcola]
MTLLGSSPSCIVLHLVGKWFVSLRPRFSCISLISDCRLSCSAFYVCVFSFFF